MKLDESYQTRQKNLKILIENGVQNSERVKIENKLKKQFMAAWQLEPDRRRLGVKLANAIDLFKTKDNKHVRGFSHLSLYTGANDQRIIVTQPYGVMCSDIVQDLTLDDGICPEIVDATEWAFYFPGRANLFIIKFPPDYLEAMEKLRAPIQRKANEEAYWQAQSEKQQAEEEAEENFSGCPD